MAGDGERKSRKRRDAAHTSGLPSQVVCTAQGVAASKNSVELGALLSFFVVGLYLYGFWESVLALPDVDTGRRVGINLNLARLESKESLDRSLETDGGDLGTEKHLDVPFATWPVTVRDEANDYETLIHPGDKQTRMQVPKFWSAPLHNKQFFTREMAMKVGTCVEPDPNTGSHVRGDKCPLHQRTIYIAVASYRDFQCRYTVESVFGRAKYPERLRVGIVDQIVEGEDPICNEPIEPCSEKPEQALCKYRSQIDTYKMPAHLSVGPVFARHIGHRLYRGEYYTTQSDAHVTYTLDWDVDIIEQMEATHNEMAVLSTYLTDVQGSIDPAGHSLRTTRPIMCNTYYEGGPQGLHLRHGSQPERRPSIHGTPQLQPWWAAGYSFSRGHFAVNVPYDEHQPMIFQGEEMSIGIRGFTIGYDFYAPERSVCFHHYAVGKNKASREKVKHFWENGNRYAGTGVRAMARLLGIVHMNPEVKPSLWDHVEEDMYGIGGVRTPEKFYELFGIDVVEKTTQGHLCMFVAEQGRMHTEFVKFLRADGMGIDLSKTRFAWVDPNPDEK
mmetsp:Transcript_81926/g.123043  ORF Transcript_81926/g.123043 Transcript_81926/m.123043 type:complete len:557 (+) Transcript_81926:59-1729(+)